MDVAFRGAVFLTGLFYLGLGIAQAQRPPKYIRTPNVEVYIDPWGGKHVRTPFKEIHKPGRIPAGYWGPPVYAVPVQPMLDQPVPQQVLMPHEAVPQAAVPTDRGDLPPDAQARAELYGLAGTLKRSLQTLSTGAGWQQHFGLTPGGVLDPNQRISVAASPAPELAIMLGRFESVIANPEYATIAALPGFYGTRNMLHEYLAKYAAEADSPADADSPAEVLPPPQPDNVPVSRLRQ
jgi:hypothetical protein